MLDPIKVQQAEESLYALLGPELAEVTELIRARPGTDNPYMVTLPESYLIDHSMEEIAGYVARASNVYQRVARFAAMASAEYKIARGRYERKYKRSRVGRNDADRDAVAMETCATEHAAMVTAEAIATLAQGLEAQARIASESARKILGYMQPMLQASQREDMGRLRDDDFSTF